MLGFNIHFHLSRQTKFRQWMWRPIWWCHSTRSLRSKNLPIQWLTNRLIGAHQLSVVDIGWFACGPDIIWIQHFTRQLRCGQKEVYVPFFLSLLNFLIVAFFGCYSWVFHCFWVFVEALAVGNSRLGLILGHFEVRMVAHYTLGTFPEANWLYLWKLVGSFDRRFPVERRNTSFWDSSLRLKFWSCCRFYSERSISSLRLLDLEHAQPPNVLGKHVVSHHHLLFVHRLVQNVVQEALGHLTFFFLLVAPLA